MPVSVVDLFGEREQEEIQAIDLQNDFIGRAGEHIVCAALAEMGAVVHLVPSPGYDLIADADGELVRIQVKTSGAATDSGRYSFSVLKEFGRHRRDAKRVKRPLDRRDCDVVALVALDKRRAIFLPVEKCENKYIPVSQREFETPDVERQSWLASLQ